MDGLELWATASAGVGFRILWLLQLFGKPAGEQI